jgi:hypothetical protein
MTLTIQGQRHHIQVEEGIIQLRRHRPGDNMVTGYDLAGVGVAERVGALSGRFEKSEDWRHPCRLTPPSGPTQPRHLAPPSKSKFLS